MKQIQRYLVLTALVVALIGPGVSLAQTEMNMIIGVKQGTGYLNTDLDGTAFFGGIGFYDLNTSGVQAESNWGVMTANSGPPTDLNIVGYYYNSDDSAASPFSQDGTYTVNSNGIVDMDIDTATQTNSGKGYLSNNRHYMAIRHATVWSGGEIMLKTGFSIKQGAGPYATTDLDGIFYFHDF